MSTGRVPMRHGVCSNNSTCCIGETDRTCEGRAACVKGGCAPRTDVQPASVGGAGTPGGIRTPDPVVRSHVL